MAGARPTQRSTEAELRRILTADEGFVEVLRAVRELDLPQAAIGAGAVRAVVWDALSGREPPTRIEEVDVAYFDGRVLSSEVEDRAERRLAGQLPQLRWDVKNQAAVHTWYERRFGVAVQPLHSLEAAVGTWPETATAVAVRLEEDDDLTVVAPLGLEDLFGMVWRHNPTRATRAAFLRRLADKRPEARWPSVRVIDPH